MKVKTDALPQNPIRLAQTGNLRPPVVPTPVVKSIVGKIADAFHLPTTHSDYKAQLRGLPDAMLTERQAQLEAKIRDASTGPGRDAQAAARARAQLAEVNEELKARDAFATSADPAFARSTHQQPTAEILGEMARQSERLREATTGLCQDPAAAADARRKLEVARKELGARAMDAFQGKLPEDPPSEPLGLFSKLQYAFSAGRMSEAELRAEATQQGQALTDATTGAHQDPVAAENARTRLKVVEDNLARRFGPPDTVGAYKDDLRARSDAALAAEKAKLERTLADASTGPSRDAGAAALAEKKLALVEEEQKTRDGFASAPQPEFSKQVHQLSDAQVTAERARQVERYREATTGVDRDPAKARDAQEKLQALMHETLRRGLDDLRGKLPLDPPARPVSTRALVEYRGGLRDDSDAMLAAKKARLEATLSDAGSGAHQDPVAIENAQKKLALIADEQADRARLASATVQPAYARQVHGLADDALGVEVRRQLERLAEASTGFDRDPKTAADAREKLSVLQAEQQDRRRDAEKITGGFKWPRLQPLVG